MAVVIMLGERDSGWYGERGGHGSTDSNGQYDKDKGRNWADRGGRAYIIDTTKNVACRHPKNRGAGERDRVRKDRGA